MKSVIQSRLEFLKTVGLETYVFNKLVRWTSYEVLHSLSRICISRWILENEICGPTSPGISAGRQIWEERTLLKTKHVIQRRLDLLKAARFGRYISHTIVWWVVGEGLYSLGRIWISSGILGNQICDPASAGISEGRQIWDLCFKQTCSLDFLLGPHTGVVWAAYAFLDKSLKIKSVVQRHLEFLKAGRFGRYLLNDIVWWASGAGLHSLCRI